MKEVEGLTEVPVMNTRMISEDGFGDWPVRTHQGVMLALCWNHQGFRWSSAAQHLFYLKNRGMCPASSVYLRQKKGAENDGESQQLWVQEKM